MGACCTKDYMYGGYTTYDKDDRDSNGDDGEEVRRGDDGATVRLRGSSTFTSMFTQRGRKGINQDAMTVWEDFSGEKDLIFCGVFDGHGPSGHRVARHARDVLPTKLSKSIKKKLCQPENGVVSEACVEPDNNGGKQRNRLVSKWEAALEESFKEVDQELSLDSSIDCFCSGTTAVTIIKQVNFLEDNILCFPIFIQSLDHFDHQGEHLVVANVGDSRAVLRWRLSRSSHVKIRRRFLPQRLRSHLNTSSLMKLQIWDVLTNNQVINIVASVRNRSMAAKLVVKLAVREWKRRFPGSMIDDCAVICLFFKNPPLLTKSMTSVGRRNVRSHPELAVSRSCRSMGVDRKRGEREEEVEGGSMKRECSKEEQKGVQGLTRADSLTRATGFTKTLSHNQRMKKFNHEVEAR